MLRPLRTVSALAFTSALTPALAQDPCAAFKAQGASVSGFAGARVDTLKSGSSVICEM